MSLPRSIVQWLAASPLRIAVSVTVAVSSMAGGVYISRMINAPNLDALGSSVESQMTFVQQTNLDRLSPADRDAAYKRIVEATMSSNFDHLRDLKHQIKEEGRVDEARAYIEQAVLAGASRWASLPPDQQQELLKLFIYLQQWHRTSMARTYPTMSPQRLARDHAERQRAIGRVGALVSEGNAQQIAHAAEFLVELQKMRKKMNLDAFLLPKPSDNLSSSP